MTGTEERKKEKCGIHHNTNTIDEVHTKEVELLKQAESQKAKIRSVFEDGLQVEKCGRFLRFAQHILAFITFCMALMVDYTGSTNSSLNISLWSMGW